MNISILVVTILGGAFLGHTPLNVIQMLWVNLIMDILGAIAIGTEPYNQNSSSQSTANQSRISRKEKIIVLEMWR